MTNDFLFELGVEELPSALVLSLSEALKISFLAALERAQLSLQSAQVFATPRRIALLIKGLDSEQPEQRVYRRGPALKAAYDATGHPTLALQGFADACAVPVDALSVSKTEKGEWLVYESTSPGAKTSELLPKMMKEVLENLPLPKAMRWGEGRIEFARPVHWLVMLWGEVLLNAEMLGTKADRYTYGHRFLAPQAIEIDKPQAYESLLRDAFVVADFAKRKASISEQIKAAALPFQAEVIMPEALLEEVTSIVEWPEALLANFEAKFLEVPAEVLIASMQEHQKCFPLQNKQGKLLPHFITVTNLKSSKPAQVIAGNEQVMRARLSDAAFFYEQDKKKSLSSLREVLKSVIFQVKLGSLYDKVQRMTKVMHFLSKIFALNQEEAIRAAELSKSDLMTGMVGEFPALQGVMGYYYAINDVESPAVALALREQYYPRFADDSLPTLPLGMALSLTDRMDTLVGIFAINQKPTGDSDPFKLRRHALAIVRILMKTPQPLHLSALMEEALQAYGEMAVSKTVLTELKPFILERLYSYYHAQGLPADLIQACLACQSDWFYDLDARITALSGFVQKPEAQNLAIACKRVNNILQQAKHSSDSVHPSLLEEEAEKTLHQALNQTEADIKPLALNANYADILLQLAMLAKPIDAFFDKVMVMVEDSKLKTNRLGLLVRLQKLLMGVADFSLLQI